MKLAAMYIVPSLGVILLSRGRSLVRADARSFSAVAGALACLALSGAGIVEHTGVVTLAFALGAGAVTHVVWLSAGRRWLATVAFLGAAANVVAIASRGRMPVSATARSAVADRAIVEPGLLAAKHLEVETIHATDRLGDVIPVGPLDAVVSIGDLMLLAAFVLVGLLGPRPSAQAGPKATIWATDGSSSTSSRWARARAAAGATPDPRRW